MPRDVTITFGDGSSHVYNGVPDDATPDAVIARAGKEFAGKAITNIDGGKAAQAEPLPMPPMARPAPPAPGVPTYDPNRRDQAQAIRETITGPDTGTTQDWLKKQQGIEARLRAEGMNDAAIAGHPEWQAASKNLSRSVSAGDTSTAIGETAVGPLAGLAMKGAAKAAKPVVGMVRDAIGKESAAATKEISGQAQAGIRALTSDAEAKLAERQALGKATEGRPDARVIDVTKTAMPNGEKLTQARTGARDLERHLSEANTKLQAAQRNMASMDKYAGQRRSEAMVRTARRDLNKAQSDVNRLTLQRDEAAGELKGMEREHNEATKAAREAGRQEATTAKGIEKAGANAEKRIDSLNIIASKLNSAKSPADVSSVARNIADQLMRANKISETQHRELYSRIGAMVEKADSTAAARDRMVRLMKASGLLGLGAAGGSYLVRTFH